MIRPLPCLLAVLWVASCATGQPCAERSPTWRLRGPVDEAVAWPRHVRHAVACFDPVDGVLLLPAMSAAGDRTELWEWNGYRWRTLQSLDGMTPPPLADFAATFHEATGRLIIFGGTLASGLDSNRTWLWNGAFWDEPSFPDTPPEPLHAATFAYVASMEVAVLFGGVREQAAIDETWTWGLGGWRRRADGPFPHDALARLVASPDLGAAVLCNDSMPDGAERGTWRFGADGWQQLSTQPPPASSSEVITLTAHDPQTRTLVRFVRQGAQQPLERWIWSVADAAWSLDQSTESSMPTTLFDATTASDLRRKRVAVLGRRTPEGPLELWEHDWTPGGLSMARPDIAYGPNCNVQALTSGDGPLTFQWLRDGVPIEDDATFEGSQSPSLAIDGGRARCDRFDLSCRVCGPCGCIVSEAVEFAYPFLADFNVDGGIDGADIEAFMIAWEASEPAADANCDGGIDGSDVESFFRCWESGCG